MNRLKHNQRKNYKRGIAMIELIFALVIIGIALLSAPMLIQQSSKSNAVALQQEAISAVAAHTSILLTKHWDEADANVNGNSVAPILETNSSFFNNFNINHPPVGFNNIKGRRTYVQTGEDNHISTLKASPHMGSEGGDLDDIDDYDKSNLGLSLYSGETTTTSMGDYVDLNLSMKTSVHYIDDTPDTFGKISVSRNLQQSYREAVTTPLAGTSNIKFVNVKLTSENPALRETNELNKTIVLQAFSCNLGTMRQGEAQK